MRTAPVVLLAVAVTGGLLAAPPAGAATGACDEGVLGYRISSPKAYGETGGHAVVLGLSPVTRTLTFTAAEGSGCTFEPGDRWSVSSAWFRAEGTYDGTAASLTAVVSVPVPTSNAAARSHPVVVALDDVTGNDADVVDSADVRLLRRTLWSGFNVAPESPAPTCRTTVLRAGGQLLRASWTAQAYRPFAGQPVALLRSAGRTVVHDLESEDLLPGATDSTGRVRWDVRPPADVTWSAHVPATSTSAHDDSRGDFVDCTS